MAPGPSENVWIAGRRLQVIDLSVRLSNATSAFEPNPHEITYIDHHAAAQATGAYGIDPSLWPDGRAWAVETVTLSSHAGTHVDAPYHYGPQSGGAPARTIDAVPLKWCIGPGVLLDMTHKADGEDITDGDVAAELERIDHELAPGDIVLIRTDASKRFAEPGYQHHQPGLRRSATEWLVDRGVRLIGIDAWTIDRPFSVMAAEARAGDRHQLWESHFLGCDKEYSQIEKLTNLDTLPRPTGFSVVALPVKLEAASAGWARVVALIDREGAS